MGKIIIIAAVGKNLELGKDNDLIWHIKGDMKFFKEHTINHHILMGKNTFISLPKMLTNRIHLVLSRNGDDLPSDVILLNSIEDFINYSKNIDDDIYVIGGASIYKQMIDLCDEMLLTEIDDICKDADVYFPSFKDKDWNKQIIEKHLDNNPPYSHTLYKKKRKN